MVSGRYPTDATQRRSSSDEGAIPRFLGPYELLQELGRGAMGAVFLARRPGLDRLFALKLVRADGDPQTDERLRREARLASGLEHPGIVACLDVGSDPQRGLRWLAMDFVPGHTLQELLRARGRLGPAEAAGLVAEVAEAVGAAHAAGVIHRDLKPANVMIDARSGRPRVTDFGLAREEGGQSLTRTGDVIGTPAYMSPEQLLGQRADARSDVWALGAILYELVTGLRPVRGQTMIELASELTGGRIEPPSRHVALPAPLEAAILRALAHAPDQRFADGRQMAAALRELQGGLGSSPELGAGPLPSVGRPVVLALAACAVVGLVLSAALLVERGGRVPVQVHEAALAAAREEASAARASADAAREEVETQRAEAARAREEVARARAELERVEEELRQVCQLQVETHGRTGAALAWVARELEAARAAPALRATILLHVRRGEEALRLASEPPEEGPGGLQQLAFRLRVALTGRDRPGSEAAARALLQRTEPGEPLRALAELALAMGRRSELEPLLARYRRDPPQDPTALWLLIVLVRAQLGDAGEAPLIDELIALLGRYLQLVPCDSQLLEQRAVMYWARWLAAQRPDDLERSLRDLLAARDVAPLAASDWLNPGICLVSLGRPRAATFELQEALRQTQGPPSERNRARTWLGNAFMRLGREEEAGRWWLEAAATQRESATEMSEHLELASPALRAQVEQAMRGVPLPQRYRVPR